MPGEQTVLTGRAGNQTNAFRANSSGATSQIDRISLAEAIRQLPKGYRTVSILHDVEGYERLVLPREFI